MDKRSRFLIATPWINKWACLLGMFALCATSAHAIGSAAPLDLALYRPAFGEYSLGTLDLPQVGPGLGQGNAFAFLHYAYRPLVYTQAGQPLFDLLSHRITLDTGLALTLLPSRIQLGLALPVSLYQTGQLPPDTASAPPALSFPLPQAALQDLHLLAKGVFYHSSGDPQNKPQGGIGLLLDLTFPTGNADAFSGSRYPTLTASLLASFAYRRVTAALHLGGLFASSEALLLQPSMGNTPFPSNIQTGLALVYRLGIQVRVWQDSVHTLSVTTEAYGRVQPPFSDLRLQPAELLFGGVWQSPYTQMFLGVGPGLTSGVGTPDVRLVWGLRVPWPGRVKKAAPPSPALPLLPAPPPAQAIVFPTGLRCTGDPLQPDVGPVALLDQVAQLLLTHPELPPIQVIAHTSNDRYLALSLHESALCAQAVAHALQQLGVSPDRIRPLGKAFQCPVTDTQHTEALRQQNQRILFRVTTQIPTPFSEDLVCIP